jgi:hypothetical protein
VLINVRTISDPQWLDASRGDAAACIAVSIRQMQRHVIGAMEVDTALSAVLACAIAGDITCPVLISSALRRRSKVELRCLRLAHLWLNAKL